MTSNQYVGEAYKNNCGSDVIITKYTRDMHIWKNAYLNLDFVARNLSWLIGFLT